MNEKITEFTAHFWNGDSITGKMNTTPKGVRNIFSVGNFRNIGLGSKDNIQQVVSVEIHSEDKVESPQPKFRGCKNCKYFATEKITGLHWCRSTGGLDGNLKETDYCSRREGKA